MNPRQMRGDEFEERSGLLAPQPLVESAAGDAPVDGDDDLEGDEVRRAALGMALPRSGQAFG